MSSKVDEYALEEMVDAAGLEAVIETLESICYGKASHLRENWQDDAAAREWERAGAALDRITTQRAVMNVSR